MSSAFLIDLERCIGCQACVVACKTGNARPIGGNFIRITESVRGTFPNLTGTFIHDRCFHCAEAACVAVCPTGALSKQNGLTAVNQYACSGCGYCVDACPYGIPKLVDNRVSKCNGCLELTQDGGEPFCVRTCPSQAITFGEREQILAAAHDKVDAIKARYPNAQVYGETQLGGLGLVLVLLDNPTVYGLPESPQVSRLAGVWQNVSQPVSLGAIGLAAAAAGVAFVVARRTHNRDKARELAERVKQETQANKASAAAAGSRVDVPAANESAVPHGPDRDQGTDREIEERNND